MIKRTIKYTNFADETVTEDWYFHLSKTEALELEASEKGGLSELLKKIIAEEDNSKLFSLFKTAVRASVGVRSSDGRLFNKNEDVVMKFEGSGAMDELIVSLLGNEELAAEFFKGILPKELQEKAVVQFELPAEKPKVPLKDLANMSREDFDKIKNQL